MLDQHDKDRDNSRADRRIERRIRDRIRRRFPYVSMDQFDLHWVVRHAPNEKGGQASYEYPQVSFILYPLGAGSARAVLRCLPVCFPAETPEQLERALDRVERLLVA